MLVALVDKPPTHFSDPRQRSDQQSRSERVHLDLRTSRAVSVHQGTRQLVVTTKRRAPVA